MWAALAALAVGVALSAPVPGEAPASIDVFDQAAASSADSNKNYVIYAYDDAACTGDNAVKCADLEKAMASMMASSKSDASFSKYSDSVVFGKANKDAFPDHKKDFEKARVPLPAVLFWPSGHSRPSCKYDAADPSGEKLQAWLTAKLEEEMDDDDDDSLLQLGEGLEVEVEVDADADADDSMKFCQVSEAPAEAHVELQDSSNLVQVETGTSKTEQIWSYKDGQNVYFGPADNSLPKDVTNTNGEVSTMNAAKFQGMSAQNKYMLVNFKAEWCKYCGCLPPIFEKIAGNLITSGRQPNLLVTTVDGDKSPALRDLFNVEVYPTILLVNRDSTKVLGRYLGPRKMYEISNWAEDLIVADENPIVKTDFDVSDKPDTHDAFPVFPYEGDKAFAPQTLVQLEATTTAGVGVGVGGNDVDECTDADANKFTAPGAALLIHYSSDNKLELDQSVVSTQTVPTKLMIIDFYQPWCPHCTKLNPVWDTVAKEFEGKDVVVGKVNLENHPEVKKDFGIKKFPTIVFFQPGEKMAYDESRRYKGKRNAPQLHDWIGGLIPAAGTAAGAHAEEVPPPALKASHVGVEAEVPTAMKAVEVQTQQAVDNYPAPAPALALAAVAHEDPAPIVPEPAPVVLPPGASTVDTIPKALPTERQ